MNLEQIQNEIANSFDFDKALDILEKIDEKFEKKDLIEISNNLIKMLYQSREMHDMVFASGPLVASKSYVDNIEVCYTLDFSLGISTEVTYDLEKAFDDISNEKNIIKEELEKLLDFNQNEYEQNHENDLAFSNVRKIEKMMILLD